MHHDSDRVLRHGPQPFANVDDFLASCRSKHHVNPPGSLKTPPFIVADSITPHSKFAGSDRLVSDRAQWAPATKDAPKKRCTRPVLRILALSLDTCSENPLGRTSSVHQGAPQYPPSVTVTIEHWLPFACCCAASGERQWHLSSYSHKMHSRAQRDVISHDARTLILSRARSKPEKIAAGLRLARVSRLAALDHRSAQRAAHHRRQHDLEKCEPASIANMHTVDTITS